MVAKHAISAASPRSRGGDRGGPTGDDGWVHGYRAHADSVLRAVDRFMESEARARIVDSYTTFY